jgi:hypothetical protein
MVPSGATAASVSKMAFAMTWPGAESTDDAGFNPSTSASRPYRSVPPRTGSGCGGNGSSSTSTGGSVPAAGSLPGATGSDTSGLGNSDAESSAARSDPEHDAATSAASTIAALQRLPPRITASCHFSVAGLRAVFSATSTEVTKAGDGCKERHICHQHGPARARTTCMAPVAHSFRL